MKKLIVTVVAALSLTACVQSLSKIAPVYGCEGLSEFGCPNITPLEDGVE